MSLNNPIDSIRQIRHLAKPIDVVWAAITKPEKVACWFSEQAHYQLEVGAIGYFEWQANGCAGKYAMRIERIQAPHYFAWRWMSEADTPFILERSTLVEFTLTEIDSNNTQLEVRESGFANHSQWQANTEGWQHELSDLERYCLEN